MCAWEQARATPEKGDSRRVAITAHFQVRTIELRTLFQVVYSLYGQLESGRIFLKLFLGKCLKHRTYSTHAICIIFPMTLSDSVDSFTNLWIKGKVIYPLKKIFRYLKMRFSIVKSGFQVGILNIFWPDRWCGP